MWQPAFFRETNFLKAAAFSKNIHEADTRFTC
jgi:hypothetical protein